VGEGSIYRAIYREKQEGNSVMSNRSLWVRRNKEEETAPYVAKRKNGATR
jgi:hypothetical protein